MIHLSSPGMSWSFTSSAFLWVSLNGCFCDVAVRFPSGKPNPTPFPSEKFSYDWGLLNFGLMNTWKAFTSLIVAFHDLHPLGSVDFTHVLHSFSFVLQDKCGDRQVGFRRPKD